MRWIVWTVMVSIAVVGIVVSIGWLLPQNHEAWRTARFNQPPESLFDAVRQQVEEEQKSGDVAMETTDTQPPTRLITRVSPGQPFGGTWTFELVPDGSGTRLTITERGEIYNPIFRFMSRFVFGYTATMDAFLQNLRKRVGEAQG
jgi:hypothetical protein